MPKKKVVVEMCGGGDLSVTRINAVKEILELIKMLENMSSEI